MHGIDTLWTGRSGLETDMGRLGATRDTFHYMTMAHREARVGGYEPHGREQTAQLGMHLQGWGVSDVGLTALLETLWRGLDLQLEQRVQYFSDMGLLDDGLIGQRHNEALHAFRSKLDGAASVAECISLLRYVGLDNAADRMTCLKTWADEDPDSDALEIGSVRAAVRFLAEHRLPADPDISAGDDGLAYLAWMFDERGMLGMRFMQSGLVTLVAIFYDSDSNRHSLSGTLAPGDALAAAKPIWEKLFSS